MKCPLLGHYIRSTKLQQLTDCSLENMNSNKKEESVHLSTFVTLRLKEQLIHWNACTSRVLLPRYTSQPSSLGMADNLSHTLCNPDQKRLWVKPSVEHMLPNYAPHNTHTVSVNIQSAVKKRKRSWMVLTKVVTAAAATCSRLGLVTEVLYCLINDI